ncbi:rod-binding protein [Phenylobacterium sp.]|uniref:rod-binding protein n=1 Tax=Phenylobacterium sp. TaxID=1871053 RepID=UPI0028114DFC|nr:rod-binding protein [Phenylobacterium sp.]
MTDLAATPALLAQPAMPTAADLAKRAKIREAAEQFEAQFLSVMLQPMFEGTEPDGMFSGGAGETMFRSLMTEAMGKQMTKAGGIGLADTVQREILKLQGLE